MPEITPCPRCGRKIRVADELFGQRVRCPSCNVAFVVETADEEETPERRRPEAAGEREDRRPARRGEIADAHEEPSRRRRRRGASGATELSRVRTGVTFLLGAMPAGVLAWMLVFVAVTLFSAALFSVVTNAGSGKELAGSAVTGLGGGILVIVSAAFVLLVSHALSLTGHIFCLFSPAQHGARILAIVAMVLCGLSLLSCFGSFAFCGIGAPGRTYSSSNPPLDMGPRTSSGIAPPGLLVEFLFDLADKVVLLFFFRSVALGIRDDNVAHSTFYLLIGMGVGLALNFILGCVNMLLLVGGAVFAMKDFNAARHALGGTGVIVLVLSMVIVFIWVLLFIWYMIVSFQFRSALSARLESSN